MPTVADDDGTVPALHQLAGSLRRLVLRLWRGQPCSMLVTKTAPYFAVLRHVLANGESAKLSGSGNFQLRDKRPRPGRNPKSGAPPIPPRRVVTLPRKSDTQGAA
jgi:hypothetical protein